MYYPDGHSPPPDIIAKWLLLLSETFDNPQRGDETPCIALHCVAGLGRYYTEYKYAVDTLLKSINACISLCYS